MKKFYLLIVLFLVIVIVYQLTKSTTEFSSLPKSEKNISSDLKNYENTRALKEKNLNTPLSESIFIPYWNIPEVKDVSKYHEVLYFGVAPAEDGRLSKDEGFKKLANFTNKGFENEKKSLVIRMLNTNVNTKILENSSAQDVVIGESIDLAKSSGFDSLALDLEVSVLPFEDVKKNISNFIEKFASNARGEGIGFSTILYGDLFYRGRPYDLASIEKSSDKIMIMTYDFSKPRGEPGPNFPFEGGENYSYDFKKMIKDFTSVVSAEKLTIIFGMYGYDWTLGPQGLPLKVAKAIPLYEIENKSIPLCKADCKINVDKKSLEKEIVYIDAEGFEHVIWFEDFESAGVKTKYLQNEGVSSVGYWVWGYF